MSNPSNLFTNERKGLMDTSLTRTRTNGTVASLPAARPQAITSVAEDLLLQIARCCLRIGEKATGEILQEAQRDAADRNLPVELVQLAALYRVLEDGERWPWDQREQATVLGDFLNLCQTHGLSLVLRAAARVSGCECLVRFAAVEARRRAAEAMVGPTADAYRADAALLFDSARRLRGERAANLAD
jgi:hypothetical protein